MFVTLFFVQKKSFIISKMEVSFPSFSEPYSSSKTASQNKSSSDQRSQISLAFRSIESFLKPVNSKLSIDCDMPCAKISEPEEFRYTKLGFELKNFCEKEFNYNYKF